MSVRDDIISAAYDIFCRKGYDDTTVQEIVDTSGSSKGGFYHHFRTKAEVIEAIMVGFAKGLDIRYRSLIEDKSKSVFELINNVIIEVNDYKADMISSQPGIAKMLSYEGNTRAITLMAQEFEERTKSCYYELFLRGIDQGDMQPAYTQELAGMFTREIIRIYTQMGQLTINFSEEAMNDFVNSLDFLEELINDQLGLEEKRIQIKEPALKFFDNVREQTKGVE